MSYCSIADVKVVLRGTSGELPAGADTLDDDQILQAIRSAQTEIDLALSQFYITPLNPVPDVIHDITQEIAAFMSDLTYRMSKPYSITNPFWLRYQRVKAFLDGITKGTYYVNVSEDNLRQDTSEVINPYDGDLITVDMLFGPALHGHSSFAIGSGLNPRFGQNSLGLFP